MEYLNNSHNHCNPNSCNPMWVLAQQSAECAWTAEQSWAMVANSCRSVERERYTDIAIAKRADDRCAGRTPSHCAAARAAPTLNLKRGAAAARGGAPSINSAQAPAPANSPSARPPSAYRATYHLNLDGLTRFANTNYYCSMDWFFYENRFPLPHWFFYTWQ